MNLWISERLKEPGVTGSPTDSQNTYEESLMQVVSIISTKGGVGKTTTAANLGGLVADAGCAMLLLDLDVQPTLSSYYELAHRALAASTSCWHSMSSAWSS